MDRPFSIPFQVRQKYGVEANHAYSLMKCFEEKLDNGQPIRLVQIDGLFYMSFDDFVMLYSGCQLCPVGTKPIPNNEELEEDVGEEESKGFFSSMFGSFW